MIQIVTDAISEAIYGAFGDRHEIYTEQVEQGLKEPCFLVTCLNPSFDRDLDRRFRRDMLFSVQFFPASTTKISECERTLETLFDTLYDLPCFGRVIHGRDLNGQINDGVLTMTVKYNLFALKDAIPTAIMERLIVESRAKGNENEKCN